VNPTRDSTLADPGQLVADLQRQLADLQGELATSNAERDAALAREAAAAEVLQVINSSPGELAPVFDAILEKAQSLCGAVFGLLFTYDGERINTATLHNIPDGFAEFLRRGPVRPASETTLARVIEERRPIQVADVMAEDPYRDGDPFAITAVDSGGVRTVLSIPLIKDNAVLGVISVFRQEVRPFSDKQIALLQNFAAQAVIAMENARLLTETREALEQQTATAQVLTVINSSPGDLQPVFDAVLNKALHLCGAAFGILWTFDGEFVRALAVRGATAEYAEFLTSTPHRPGIDNAHGRLIRGEEFVHIADVAADAAYHSEDPVRKATVELGGARTLLAVALRKEGAVLGFFVIYRREVLLFSDKQIALLQNFAAQAVIAMENARLLTETRQALEQQTATAEVLQVINSSPGDLAPVFDAMLEKACLLCDAQIGTMWIYQGESMQAAAIQGAPSAYAEFLRRTPTHPISGEHRRLLGGERFIHNADVTATETYRSGHAVYRAAADLGGIRTFLGVPLRKDDDLLGHFGIYRQEVRPFTDKQIVLLQSFAAQAVIAMDNARLLNEIRQRQSELRVTFDNMGDGVAMFDADLRLAAWNMNFRQMLDLTEEFVATHPSYAGYLRYLAERGEFGEVEIKAEVARRLEAIDQDLRFEHTRPDDRVTEVRRNPVPGGGFVLIYGDVTERKRAEAEIALRATLPRERCASCRRRRRA
jgi:GAF domain-containing protein